MQASQNIATTIDLTKVQLNGNHVEKNHRDHEDFTINGVESTNGVAGAVNGVESINGDEAINGAESVNGGKAINGGHHIENSDSHIKARQSVKGDDSVSYDDISESANYILGKTRHRPKIGVICGTGLGALAETVSDADFIPYSTIPNFPVSTVEGHVGRLVIGTIGNVSVLLMQGRFHSYEGYPLSQCAMPVRVMKLMGIEKLIVTNAAGGINPNYKVGDFMVIKDHINLPGFTGRNPLRGHNDKRFGPRFFPVVGCYSSRWREVASQVAADMGISADVHQGVFVMLGGPNFESVAEIKLLKLLGADCVGMSTIPEVLVATHCGMSVLAMSLVTNLTSADYDGDVEVGHDEVMDNAKKREPVIKEFVSKIIKSMDQDSA